MLAEGVPGGFSSLYDSFAALETLGACRRGYFIEGLGGAQFALPGAVERLRAQRDDDASAPSCSPPPTRRSPTARVLKWPQRLERRSPAAPPAPTSCSPAATRSSTSSAAARACRCWSTPLDERIGPALAELADAVHRGRIKRLALERIDGEPVVGSEWEGALIELGFRSGPRKLTLTA